MLTRNAGFSISACLDHWLSDSRHHNSLRELAGALINSPLSPTAAAEMNAYNICNARGVVREEVRTWFLLHKRDVDRIIRGVPNIVDPKHDVTLNQQRIARRNRIGVCKFITEVANQIADGTEPKYERTWTPGEGWRYCNSAGDMLRVSHGGRPLEITLANDRVMATSEEGYGFLSTQVLGANEIERLFKVTQWDVSNEGRVRLKEAAERILSLPK